MAAVDQAAVETLLQRSRLLLNHGIDVAAMAPRASIFKSREEPRTNVGASVWEPGGHRERMGKWDRLEVLNKYRKVLGLLLACSRGYAYPTMTDFLYV